MHFVDRPGSIERIHPRPAPEPLAIAPFIRELPHYRGGAWRHLAIESEWIALVDGVGCVPRDDVILVQRAGAHAAYERFPDARGIRSRLQTLGGGAPAVEITYNGYGRRIRRPNAEVSTLSRARLRCRDWMGSQLLVGPDMRAFPEKIDILVREQHLGSLASRMPKCWFLRRNVYRKYNGVNK